MWSKGDLDISALKLEDVVFNCSFKIAINTGLVYDGQVFAFQTEGNRVDGDEIVHETKKVFENILKSLGKEEQEYFITPPSPQLDSEI